MDRIFERMTGYMPPNMMAEMTAYVERRLLRDMASGEQSHNIHMLPPVPVLDQSIPIPSDLVSPPKSVPTEAKEMRFPPPQVLPCANVEPAKYMACTKPGTMACSECRLVSYCSKDCQRQHWAKHKKDCRNVMRPMFITEMDLVDEFFLNGEDEYEYCFGMALWGNTPAIDIINLDLNEGDKLQDFSLAFIASGDLRHVVSTVNGLPLTYSGQLKILVNDFNPLISCRNVVLLLILGTIQDETLAADMAIHFWYSIFMPMEYKLRLSMILANFLMDTNGKTTLVQTQSDIQQEYDRVRAAHSRSDFRDRMYVGLRHSHRVAFERYRLFGLVLPFGALNAHFNCPNNSLFSPSGKWMQTDYADPLEGWDTHAVLAAGKACGAQPEDIYGCLYFFLSQEFRKFFQRIRKFKISFTVSTFDAGHDLPKVIRDGGLTELGIPSDTRFDRISVSNIFDENYVGLKPVLSFLAQNSRAVIVGYFMNWFASQPGGSWKSAGDKAINKVMEKLAEKRMGKKASPKSSMNTFRTIMVSEFADGDALYDNSVPFERFLKRRGLDNILKLSKLKLRAKHTIVPHRILAPLQGKSSDLPMLPDDDSWYYNTKLTAFTWSERYVEFARA